MKSGLSKFKIYKVGGYVRDTLLGIQSNDIDYVVIGATPKDMKNLGFVAVGKDFPVFLHPETKEEYALARTERKIGHGYHGFQFYTSPEVTLEDDLKRRDITINAMAMNLENNLIDPFNGLTDLQNRTIRHVSDAFVEDPLRILRVARFSARFGFKIAKETLSLMKKIVKDDELTYLPKERIWMEINKAFDTSNPLRFFKVLKRINALEQILPEIAIVLNNKPLSKTISSTLKQAHRNNFTAFEKYALMCGILTLNDNQIIANKINQKAIIDKPTKELAKLLINYSNQLINFNKLPLQEILNLVEKLDIRRKALRFKTFSQLVLLLADNETQLRVINSIRLIINIVEQINQINYPQISNNLSHDEFLAKIKGIKLNIIRKNCYANK